MLKDSDFKRVDVEVLKHPTDPTKKYGLYCDYWWAVDANGKALFYEGWAAQCNADENVSRMLLGRMKAGHPAVDIVQIERAWAPERV